MSSINHLIHQYQVLNNWFLYVIDGIEDKDGSKTINDGTNSIEWLAGHLITGRYRNLVRLGVQIEPYKYLDKFINQTLPPPNAIAFSKTIQYPTLTECREQWKMYSELLMERLNTLDESILKSTIPFTVPTGGNTIEDSLIFVVMHETYHIGQMSIIRKAIGYPGMQLTPKK
jgi:uncharacterized damage-inducible protein DinB